MSSPGSFPILFVDNPVPKCPRILVYFHGNAEDAAGSEHFVISVADELDCHAVLAEYPSYGVYTDLEPSETIIYENAIFLFDFLVRGLKFHPENIFVLGRSLGSGPATYLAAHRPVGLLILFSPYKSIQDVAVDHAWFFGRLVGQCFRNEEHIGRVTAPVFIVHGQKDDVIKSYHSVHLFSVCISKFKKLWQPVEMTHNKFMITTDFLNPLKEFVKEVEASHRRPSIPGVRSSYEHERPGAPRETRDFAFPLVFLMDRFRERPKN